MATNSCNSNTFTLINIKPLRHTTEALGLAQQLPSCLVKHSNLDLSIGFLYTVLGALVLALALGPSLQSFSGTTMASRVIICYIYLTPLTTASNYHHHMQGHVGCRLFGHQFQAEPRDLPVTQLCVLEEHRRGNTLLVAMPCQRQWRNTK